MLFYLLLVSVRANSTAQHVLLAQYLVFDFEAGLIVHQVLQNVRHVLGAVTNNTHHVIRYSVSFPECNFKEVVHYEVLLVGGECVEHVHVQSDYSGAPVRTRFY